MILETKNKTINLVLKTKNIITICMLLKNKNFEDGFFKAYRDNDLEALSKIIYALADKVDGQIAFSNVEEVQDFLDEYKKEQSKSFIDIYKELSEELNNEGFFTKKMTKKELAETISNPLSGTNMNELVQKSAERAISKIAEEQFQGYKA